MGTADRIVRFLTAIVIAILYFTGMINGLTAIILGTLAAIFILTGLSSYCPLYTPFNLSTKSRKKPA